MLKKVAVFLCALLLFAATALPAAAEVSVDSIRVEVTLNEDGSADIAQVWNTYADEKTEFYVPFNTGEYLALTDFKVADTEKAYTYNDDWDIDASFDEKAYTCGLNPTDGGYELCWGISQYGKNTYNIAYTVHNMVGDYEESDGFLFRFINDEMNTTPTDVELTIRLANGTKLTDETCNIWAFGYDGDIVFQNGTIVAKTASPIDYENHMTLMIELDKGILSPICDMDMAFSEVKERAFENSDYDPNAAEDDAWIVLLLFALFAAAFILLLLVTLIIKIVHRVQIKRFVKAFGYHRDVPNGGDLNVSAQIGVYFSLFKEENIIGAYLMRLMNDGCIQPVTTEKVGLFGVTAKNTDLQLCRSPMNDAYAKQLYDVLKKGMGDDDLITEKEMKKLCKKQPTLLRGFISTTKAAGNSALRANGCFKRVSPTALSHLSDAGKQQLGELFGFKQYLEDFSLLSEHELNAATVWRELMVYAVLYGIADKVIKEIRELYPEQLEEIDIYDRNTVFVHMYYRSMYSTMVQREQEIQAARSSGSGGRASFGGGGGFSGGGSGGGAR